MKERIYMRLHTKQSKAKKTKHVCRAWMWYQKKGVITMESYSTFTKPIHFTSKHKWGRCSMAFLLPFATHAHIRTQNGNWMPFSYHLIVYWRIFFWSCISASNHTTHIDEGNTSKNVHYCVWIVTCGTLFRGKYLITANEHIYETKLLKSLESFNGIKAYTYAVNRKAINKYLNSIKKKHDAMKWCDAMRIAIKASLSFSLFTFIQFHTRFT